MGLKERMEWVIHHPPPDLAPDEAWNMSVWSRRAETTRTHVERLLKRPSGNAEVSTIAKLARGAAVSACWLAFGTGDPRRHDSDAVSAALSMARAMGYDAAFVESWTPPSGEYDADVLWTVLKADYARLQRPG